MIFNDNLCSKNDRRKSQIIINHSLKILCPSIMLVPLIILFMKLLFGGVQASKNKHGSATKWFLIETEDAQNSLGFGKEYLKTFSWLPNPNHSSVELCLLLPFPYFLNCSFYNRTAFRLSDYYIWTFCHSFRHSVLQS